MKNHFIEHFDADGNLMTESYDSIIDLIHEMMKQNVPNRRVIENLDCELLIAEMKINNEITKE